MAFSVKKVLVLRENANNIQNATFFCQKSFPKTAVFWHKMNNFIDFCLIFVFLS